MDLNFISVIKVLLAVFGFTADSITFGTWLYHMIQKRRTVSAKDDSSDIWDRKDHK